VSFTNSGGSSNGRVRIDLVGGSKVSTNDKNFRRAWRGVGSEIGEELADKLEPNEEYLHDLNTFVDGWDGCR
jgi:hypothetical protein